jgi:hypothetical protein
MLMLHLLAVILLLHLVVIRMDNFIYIDEANKAWINISGNAYQKALVIGSRNLVSLDIGSIEILFDGNTATATWVKGYEQLPVEVEFI